MIFPNAWLRPVFGLLLAAQAISAASAQTAMEIVEPAKVKSSKQLRDGEGVLQISVRTQKQFIETAILYFVAVDANGQDTNRVIRFERGAGVPIMGSNMIDEKQQTYRVKADRYRVIAFTIACDGMPYAPGLACRRGYGKGFPTGFYPQGEPVFEVKAGQLTQAGDFIVEYTGEKTAPGQSLFDIKDRPFDWAVRWQEGNKALSGFDDLHLNRAEVPEAMRSRISCAARPPGVSLYIPFEC
jgi:hypothetical protein